MNDDAIPPEAHVSLERHEDVWILSLRGEHDIATADYVRELLADCRAAGQADVPPRLRVVAPADTPPRRLFDFVCLGDVLPIHETVEAARTDELG